MLDGLSRLVARHVAGGGWLFARGEPSSMGWDLVFL